MIETKLFEVRDSATLIPVMAIHLDGLYEGREDHKFLMETAGYGSSEYLILMELSPSGKGLRTEYSAFDWRLHWHNDTLSAAHTYISEHFDELKDGQVVDVEYIRGIRKEPKRSDRFHYEG